MDDIYRELILDHYKNPRNFGVIAKPTCSAHRNNPLCGDYLSITLTITNNCVADIKYQGQGCAIATAAASILSEEVRGKEIHYLKSLGKDAIVKLLGIELTPTRLKCALLSLEVLHAALP